MILKLDMTILTDCNCLLEVIIHDPILWSNLFVELEVSTIDPHTLVHAIIHIMILQM